MLAMLEFLSGLILGVYLGQTYHLPSVKAFAVKIYNEMERFKKEHEGPDDNSE